MLVGYARVAAEQNPDHQIDALARAGVARVDIHVDHASGAKASRPQLDLVLRVLRDGDVLVVTRLDRLGRSVLHLVTLGAQLRECGVGLKVLEQGIDTGTAEGRAMFGMLSVLAELQRELLVANTRDGLVAARARGRRGGRPAKLSPDQVALAQRLYDACPGSRSPAAPSPPTTAPCAARGFPVEFYFEIEHAERHIQRYDLHRGAAIARLDHFNIVVPDIAKAYQQHHIERGPGRHGVSNAFYLYLRDPDGHRMEIYTSDYYTGDPDMETFRWDVHDDRRRDFWGNAVIESWYKEATPVLDLSGDVMPIEEANVDESAVRVGADGLGTVS